MKWIKFEDEEPEVMKDVFMCISDGTENTEVFVGWKCSGSKLCYNHEDDIKVPRNITHWMPLPKPPTD